MDNATVKYAETLFCDIEPADTPYTVVFTEFEGEGDRYQIQILRDGSPTEDPEYFGDAASAWRYAAYRLLTYANAQYAGG